MNESTTNLNENISKSSLVSLKAELLRKQHEIQKLKNLSKSKEDDETNGQSKETTVTHLYSSQNVIQNYSKYKDKPVRKLNINEKINKNVEQRRLDDLKKKDIDIEEEQELKKSHEALLAKSEIYSDLMKGKHVIDNKSQILVNFEEKNKTDDKIPDDNLSDDDSDNEWTEFTDALGRTRKCLKEDLQHYQKQNQYLEEMKHQRENQEETVIKKDYNTNKLLQSSFEDIELLSTDMKRELLRKQWEAQEQNLSNKNNIHYQDVLFEEARQHGVGYFNLSQDEKERQNQIGQLKQMREDTKKKREQVREMRKLRKKQFKMRMIMTENRKRQSKGLPPIEFDPNSISSDEEDKIEEEKEKQEEENRLKQMINDAQSKKLEEIKKANQTREWDVNKDGQMSQEEWIKKEREKRIDEFAPPTNLYKNDRNLAQKDIHNTDKYRDKNISNEQRNNEKVCHSEDNINNDNVNTINEEMSNSIYCFKRKWSNKNSELFKKYKKKYVQNDVTLGYDVKSSNDVLESNTNNTRFDDTAKNQSEDMIGNDAESSNDTSIEGTSIENIKLDNNSLLEMPPKISELKSSTNRNISETSNSNESKISFNINKIKNNSINLKRKLMKNNFEFINKNTNYIEVNRRNSNDSDDKRIKRGVEIEPPLTYDYFSSGSGGHSSRKSNKKVNLIDSVNYGIKQIDKKVNDNMKKKEKGLLDII